MQGPTKFNQKVFGVLALTLAIGFSTLASAADEDVLQKEIVPPVQQSNNQSFNMDPMDMDGKYKKEDKLAGIIGKQDDEIKDRNDAKRTEVLEKLHKEQLAKMFDGKPVEQELTTKQASTMVATAPEEEAKKASVKIIPYGGLSQMQGEGEVNFQAKINSGLRLETVVLEERLGIGVGFNFSQIDIRDNRYVNNFSYNQQQTAPEFKYRNMSGEIYGKYFVLNKDVFRPYIGAGIGYHSSKLTHTNNQQFNSMYYTNYNQQALQNGYDSSFATGSAMVGTDLQFTKLVGLNFEFKYSRALSSAFNSNNIGVNPQYGGYDQVYLQQLGQQMDEASLMAVNMGLVVKF